MTKNNKDNRSPNLIRWDEGNFNYVDVIISSGEIRRLLFLRCKELGVDVYKMAMLVNIRPSIFKANYVDKPNPTAMRNFPQKKFLDLLELVGINIRVTVVQENIEVTSKRLKEKKQFKIKA